MKYKMIQPVGVTGGLVVGEFTLRSERCGVESYVC